MAKRKATSPVITHTEILARAIRSIDDELAHWHVACENSGTLENYDALTADLQKKRLAINTLYCIETGVDYD